MGFISELCALDTTKIILASQSPRRIEMLRAAGLQFEIRPADVDENPPGYHNEVDYVRSNAHSKAEWVWERNSADLVIAADTVVVREGRILEKPASRADARAMLQSLSAATHEVITGICLRCETQEIIDHESTRVVFSALEDREIDHYLDSGEPYDKAGAYGIQGLAGLFIERVDGCYFNVVGFPIARFYRHLRTLRL